MSDARHRRDLCLSGPGQIIFGVVARRGAGRRVRTTVTYDDGRRLIDAVRPAGPTIRVAGRGRSRDDGTCDVD